MDDKDNAKMMKKKKKKKRAGQCNCSSSVGHNPISWAGRRQKWSGTALWLSGGLCALSRRGLGLLQVQALVPGASTVIKKTLWTRY